MMTLFEQNVYNKYLAISRSMVGKPFKLRKDFEKFTEHKDYPYVHRLASFFQRFPQIDKQKYFEAPFKIYSDETYFDLKFYISQRAIKSYSIYMKQFRDQMPDSNEQLIFIRDSLRFIAKFCFENKIPIDDYISYRPYSTYSWTQHLKEHKISVYTLFGFEKLQEIINSIPNDEGHLLLGDSIDEIYRYKMRFHNAIKAKQLVQKGIDKIKKLYTLKNP